jgi:hypothetical protein
MYKPTGQEAALLLRLALKKRGDARGKEMTRARLSRLTLKLLWNREDLTEAWLAEVNEWLLSAGWKLFYAGTTFGVVKTSVVENWPRVPSKILETQIEELKRGEFDFAQLEHDLLKTEVRPRAKTRKPTARGTEEETDS